MKKFAFVAIAMLLIAGCGTSKKAVETKSQDSPIEVIEKVLSATGKGESKDWNTAKAMARINAQGELSEQFKTTVQSFASSHATVTNSSDRTDFERLIDTYSKNILEGVEYAYKGDGPTANKKVYTVVCTGTMNMKVVKRTIEGLLNNYPAESRAAFRSEMYEVFGIEE